MKTESIRFGENQESDSERMIFKREEYRRTRFAYITDFIQKRSVYTTTMYTLPNSCYLKESAS